jgi:hypothetical protein
MDERAFFRESKTTKAVNLNCPNCKTIQEYDLRWLVRRKVDRLPSNADERDRAKFQKIESYMVLLEDKVQCKNPRCRRPFDISGVKTTAFLYEPDQRVPGNGSANM